MEKIKLKLGTSVFFGDSSSQNYCRCASFARIDWNRNLFPMFPDVVNDTQQVHPFSPTTSNSECIAIWRPDLCISSPSILIICQSLLPPLSFVSLNSHPDRQIVCEEPSHVNRSKSSSAETF